MHFKKYLLLSFWALLLALPQTVLAVNPTLNKSEIKAAKKAEKKLKRQKKLIGFTEKMLAKKIDRFIARHQLFADSTKCDTIILRNGKELVAKINKISTEGVSYKKCKFPDSPEVVLSNAAIKEVIYSNGERNKIEDLVFDIAKDSDKPTEERQERKNSAMSTSQAKGLGFVLGFTLGIIGVILAAFLFADEPQKVQKTLLKNAWVGLGVVVLINLVILLAYLAIILSL